MKLVMRSMYLLHGKINKGDSTEHFFILIFLSLLPLHVRSLYALYIIRRVRQTFVQNKQSFDHRWHGVRYGVSQTILSL
jgi:hypothetical protein